MAHYGHILGLFEERVVWHDCFLRRGWESLSRRVLSALWLFWRGRCCWSESRLEHTVEILLFLRFVAAVLFESEETNKTGIYDLGVNWLLLERRFKKGTFRWRRRSHHLLIFEIHETELVWRGGRKYSILEHTRERCFWNPALNHVWNLGLRRIRWNLHTWVIIIAVVALREK